MKIVIAEHDGSLRPVLEAGRIPAGDEVVCIEARAGVVEATIAAEVPQVLILDWSAPGLAAADLCGSIRRRDPGGPYLYVIAVVQDNLPEHRAEAYRAGADSVVARPDEPFELLARLDVARRIASLQEALIDRSLELERARLDLEGRNAMLAEIASSDALTGLRNRRFFCESLDTMFSLACRSALPLSIVMIDVDEFKAFNDRFGHLAGDEVLSEVGSVLRSCVREHDIVARYGGEEFAILMPATAAEDCGPFMERLRLAVADHPWPHRPITISLGSATLGDDASRPSDLIDQADRALYHAKATGKDRAAQARDLFQPAFPFIPNSDDPQSPAIRQFAVVDGGASSSNR